MSDSDRFWSGSGTGLVWLIVLVLVAVAGLVAFWLWHSSDSPEASPSLETISARMMMECRPQEGGARTVTAGLFDPVHQLEDPSYTCSWQGTDYEVFSRDDWQVAVDLLIAELEAEVDDPEALALACAGADDPTRASIHTQMVAVGEYIFSRPADYFNELTYGNFNQDLKDALLAAGFVLRSRSSLCGQVEPLTADEARRLADISGRNDRRLNDMISLRSVISNYVYETASLPENADQFWAIVNEAVDEGTFDQLRHYTPRSVSYLVYDADNPPEPTGPNAVNPERDNLAIWVGASCSEPGGRSFGSDGIPAAAAVPQQLAFIFALDTLSGAGRVSCESPNSTRIPGAD